MRNKTLNRGYFCVIVTTHVDKESIPFGIELCIERGSRSISPCCFHSIPMYDVLHRNEDILNNTTNLQLTYSSKVKIMASTSRYRCKIKIFNGKNFAIWKLMMQNALVQHQQIEAIRQAAKPTKSTKTNEDWVPNVSIQSFFLLVLIYY